LEEAIKYMIIVLMDQFKGSCCRKRSWS